MSMHLLGKRELKRLGSVANNGAGSGYSGFAKNMMTKMGWTEGQGLGKDKQGRSTYVQVKKKDDNGGLGKERAHQDKVNDQWYFDAFDTALAKMGSSKKVKKSKSKKAKDRNQEGPGGCMYVKMFKATGGARMGMRARAAQNGKLARTEGSRDGSAGLAQDKDLTDEAAQGADRKSRKRRRAEIEGADSESANNDGDVHCGTDDGKNSNSQPSTKEQKSKKSKKKLLAPSGARSDEAVSKASPVGSETVKVKKVKKVKTSKKRAKKDRR